MGVSDFTFTIKMHCPHCAFAFAPSEGMAEHDCVEENRKARQATDERNRKSNAPLGVITTHTTTP